MLFLSQSNIYMDKKLFALLNANAEKKSIDKTDANNISDEILSAYIDNELEDEQLITLIENSHALQLRLTPFRKSLSKIENLKMNFLDADVPEKLILQKNHDGALSLASNNNTVSEMELSITAEIDSELLIGEEIYNTKKANKLRQELQDTKLMLDQLNTNILSNSTSISLLKIVDQGLNKNKTNKVTQLLPKKLKIFLGSILTLERSPALYGVAASMLLAVGVYFNIQNINPEWQDRYAALGYETGFIDSDEWFMSTATIENYSMPVLAPNDLTIKVNNLNIINNNNEDTNAQDDNQETNKMSILDQQLMTIDANLSGRYLIGVFHDMTSKKTPIAEISRAGNESLNLKLYGKNVSKDNCILGEIIYKSSLDSDNSINSKFFNFCAFDTSTPLQLIN